MDTIKKAARLDVALTALAAITLVVITQTQALGVYSPTGQLEVAAVLFTGLCVWMAVKNSIWTWPVGIVGTCLYFLLFMEWQLYADAGLQIVYMILGVLGLWAWYRRGHAEQLAEAERTSIPHLLAVLACVAVGTVVVREYLIVVGGAAPFWDALLTSGSLGAQYLLIRKRIENWTVWAVLDAAYVALFIDRGYYLTAALYAVFFCMVVKAAFEWRELLPAAEAGDGRIAAAELEGAERQLQLDIRTEAA